jgi:Toprim domain
MESVAADLAQRLAERAEAVCHYYLPNGVRCGAYWIAGDVAGAKGRSLYVRLRASSNAAAGKFVDAATGDHGDLLDLIRLNRGLTTIREALDEARAFLNEPRRAFKSVTSEVTTRNPDEAAARLFALTSPVPGTIAETYLRGRGITGDLAYPALGFLASCYYRAEGSIEPKTLPALIARVTDLNGRTTGVHRTWLRADGSGKADLPEPRKALGELHGRGVRFGIPSVVLAAGEGIETMLALRSVLLHLPSVAALSAAHLGALRLPDGLRRLYIACDNDRAGLDAGLALASRAISQGIAVRLLVPDRKDFNDDLKSLGMASLVQRLGPHLWRDDQGILLPRLRLGAESAGP